MLKCRPRLGKRSVDRPAAHKLFGGDLRSAIDGDLLTINFDWYIGTTNKEKVLGGTVKNNIWNSYKENLLSETKHSLISKIAFNVAALSAAF